MYSASSGYRDEGDAGLEHVGALYYDKQVGRFITRDTVLTEHPYLYCEHDPVNYNDPSGHGQDGLIRPGDVDPKKYKEIREAIRKERARRRQKEIDEATKNIPGPSFINPKSTVGVDLPSIHDFGIATGKAVGGPLGKLVLIVVIDTDGGRMKLRN
jgi:RHS repeat-associated protein